MNAKSVLIVDDDACIRLAYSKVFAKTSYEVRTAEDAESALVMMRAAPAGVVFLDLDLPGMNGIELCREICHLWPWCNLVAVTGFASVFELVRCREAGFDDYFTKPVESRDLLEAAQTAFRKLERWRKRRGAVEVAHGSLLAGRYLL